MKFDKLNRLIKLILNRYQYSEIKQYFIHIVKHIWYIEIKNTWNKLYIRKDEFHSSVDLDYDAMMLMNKKQRERYVKNLTKRRDIAHKRELKN